MLRPCHRQLGGTIPISCYLKLGDHVHLVPVNEPPFLDHQPPPHVATVEIAQLNKVVMDVDKTEDDCADNTKTKKDDNDEDFFLNSVIPETDFYYLEFGIILL